MTVRTGSINDRRISNNDIKSNNYLQVNSCGIYEGSSELSRIFRPFGRVDYQIIIIFSGGATFTHNNKKIILSSGEMILIPPLEVNDYTYTNPIDAMWIHFSGTEIESILKSYSINPFVAYKLINTDSLKVFAEKIIKEFNLKKIGYMHNCNGYLLNILTSIKRDFDSETVNYGSSFTELIPIIEDMKTNFHKQKSISEYAGMIHMSVSRFTHIFTEKIGVSPYSFLIKTRINKAKGLLQDTNIPVCEIAHSVGYNDAFCFSRIFKKYVGISPQQYRKDGI